MKILAIETSCDETAIAVLEAKGTAKNPSISTLSHNVASQIALHTQYGGVFPMMAKREHSKNIVPLFKETIEQSFSSQKLQVKSQKLNPTKIKKLEKILAREPELLEQFLPFIISTKKPAIDVIAVTVGPGLEPALWVGINFARALSYMWDIPVIPVNHMEGHILSVLAPKQSHDQKLIINSEKWNFPAISLLVSGGHTELVLVKDWGKYKVIGQTRDDAVGEAFDKVARMLDLPYPGGPEISKLAEIARNSRLVTNEKIKLPRPMIYTKDFDFSFSGLKTAVLYLTRDLGEIGDTEKKLIAREFEDSAIEVLVHKTAKAMQKYKATTLIVGGGVSANTHLKRELESKAESENLNVHFPTRELSTDNAIMIGIVGIYKFLKTKKGVRFDSKRLVATGNLQF